MKLSWEDSWHKKGFWNLAREKRWQERGAMPEEEGDVIREYNALHEEHFLSGWLRDVEGEGESQRRWRKKGDERGGMEKR